MDFFELIAARHSVRSFAPFVLPRDDLDAILGAARRAPSAGNLQSWVAVTVEGPALPRVAKAAGEDFIAGASAAIVFAADAVRSAGEYGGRGAELYSVQDATIACTYAQLAATSLGLANVWIGAFDESEVARSIGLESGLRPIALLAVGHAAERGAVTSRRPLESLVRRVTT